MRSILFFVLIHLLVLSSLPVMGQPSESSAIKMFKAEKDRFLLQLKAVSIDSVIVNPLARQVEADINAIYNSIRTNGAMPNAEKEKAIKSMVYFMKEVSNSLEQQKLVMYDIPGALQSYKNILNAIVNQKPVQQELLPLAPRRSQLLTAAFSQYKEYPLMDDISVYKRVASSPEFIIQFLENKPGFRYADSLILKAAAHDPLKLISYLNKVQPGLQERIRSNNNIYLREIVSLSTDRNASELLPFIPALAEDRITPEEILEKRTDVVRYFQLLVNTLQEAKKSTEPSAIFLQPLRRGIREKSLAFFVNHINELHSASDATRFASVKGLRPEDLYYIITSSGDDLYTSSYLGLYKRLMEHFKDQAVDSLFEMVGYDNFHVFMRLAANYNVLADFLRRMPQEHMQVLLRRYISGIESDTESGLEKAMDIADSFTGVDSVAEINAVIQDELRANLARSTAGKHYLGIRLYSILLQVFDLVKEGEALNKLWSRLGNYEILKKDALVNRRGEIVQLVLFYGDDDGIASFNNFLKLYADTSKWVGWKNDNWVSFRSNSEVPVIIYANRPLDIKEEMDLKAQDSLFAFLKDQSMEPTVLIHRGHSYHLDKTLRRLNPTVKLAILGSCGSYNKGISIATISPDVQVIGSKKTGSKSINDPIINVINETLLNNKDLYWPEIWKKLAARFSKDEATLNLFNEYFPPSDNLSLFVLKLFNYYNRFV